MKKEPLFQTKDIALAAYLLVKGNDIRDTDNFEWVIYFSFLQSPEISQQTLDYFNNEWQYLSFSSRLKDLKTLIHNKKSESKIIW